MILSFDSFKDLIEIARRIGFTENAKLIMLGKVEYARQRGDLSGQQMLDLINLIDPEMYIRYLSDAEIADGLEPDRNG